MDKKKVAVYQLNRVALVLSVFGFRSLNKKVYKLDRERITTTKVKEGDFPGYYFG